MLKNLQSKEEEEEEEEQCSPVSVLDPPFEDDEGHEDFDIESSFAIVQSKYTINQILNPTQFCTILLTLFFCIIELN